MGEHVRDPAAAEDDADGSASTSSGPPGSAADPAKPRGRHPGETLLTGTNAAKAKTASLKALPGATVKFDKDFTVTSIETGNGGGRGHDAPSGTTT